MIQIEQCDSCTKKYERLRGHCPIWQTIQSGVEVIEEAMVKAQSESKPHLVSVVVAGHWLTECKFDCDFFESATPS